VKVQLCTPPNLADVTSVVIFWIDGCVGRKFGPDTEERGMNFSTYSERNLVFQPLPFSECITVAP